MSFIRNWHSHFFQVHQEQELPKIQRINPNAPLDRAFIDATFVDSAFPVDILITHGPPYDIGDCGYAESSTIFGCFCYFWVLLIFLKSFIYFQFFWTCRLCPGSPFKFCSNLIFLHEQFLIFLDYLTHHLMLLLVRSPCWITWRIWPRDFIFFRTTTEITKLLIPDMDTTLSAGPDL